MYMGINNDEINCNVEQQTTTTSNTMWRFAGRCPTHLIVSGDSQRSVPGALFDPSKAKSSGTPAKRMNSPTAPLELFTGSIVRQTRLTAV